MANIVENFTNYRIRSIEIAEAEYYETLIRTLDKIETDVINLVNKNLPKSDDFKLFNLRSAIAVQPLIRQTLEKEYLRWSDTVVRDGFNKQAKRIERAFREVGNIPLRFQQLTESDLTLIQNLKRQTYTQFKDVSNTFTRRLSEKIYQYTLIGSDPVELEEELRRTINGIYASAKDSEVNELVKSIKRDEVRLRKLDKRTVQGKALKNKLDKNIQTLQSKFARDRAGENMKRYAGQILNDSLREFDATLNLAKSNDAGLTHVVYQGSNIPTTRDFCRLVRSGAYDKRNGGLFTIDEVRKLWRRNWKGKKPGDPFIVRGGYNCRHQWSFVNPDWYDRDGNLIIE
jgi:hypothetical protein|tara:strand:- start:381 stop:1409 length:1029 start_codon:yes stop_codon:yes gene_type:complete